MQGKVRFEKIQRRPRRMPQAASGRRDRGRRDREFTERLEWRLEHGGGPIEQRDEEQT